MTNKQQKRVKALLFRHRSIISTREHDIGRTNLVEHRIDTSEHRPIRLAFRHHSFRHLDWIDSEVNEMIHHGIAEPAALPWAFNIVLLKKKDESLRFCVDYRRLNAVAKQDTYPLPLLTTVLMPWLNHHDISRRIFALDTIIFPLPKQTTTRHKWCPSVSLVLPVCFNGWWLSVVGIVIPVVPGLPGWCDWKRFSDDCREPPSVRFSRGL